jgi:hypothetical protein
MHRMELTKQGNTKTVDWLMDQLLKIAKRKRLLVRIQQELDEKQIRHQTYH